MEVKYIKNHSSGKKKGDVIETTDMHALILVDSGYAVYTKLPNHGGCKECGDNPECEDCKEKEAKEVTKPKKPTPPKARKLKNIDQ